MPSPLSADTVAQALAGALRDVLGDTRPDPDLDPDTLAARLAPLLVERLAAQPGAGTESPSTPESRVLEALRRHPAGRSPGIGPEALGTLTGLPSRTLGPAVSALVQAGELVREGWLVRLPREEDLLPPRSAGAADADRRGGDRRELVERRAVGDRRNIGDRRLYDRRGEQ